jgi:hypothetical protein
MVLLLYVDIFPISLIKPNITFVRITQYNADPHYTHAHSHVWCWERTKEVFMGTSTGEHTSVAIMDGILFLEINLHKIVKFSFCIRTVPIGHL